jgi:hypothetical protein
MDNVKKMNHWICWSALGFYGKIKKKYIFISSLSGRITLVFLSPPISLPAAPPPEKHGRVETIQE